MDRLVEPPRVAAEAEPFEHHVLELPLSRHGERPCEERLVDSLAGLWKEIRQGRFDPNRVHEKIQPYSVENQMARLFACHRALQAQYFPAAVPSALQGSAIQE